MIFKKLIKVFGFKIIPTSRHWHEGNYMCQEGAKEIYWFSFCIWRKVIYSSKILPECYKRHPKDSKMVKYKKG